jgi:predicted nucleic acid-binding protein
VSLVSDTGLLAALAKIDALALLKHLFGEVRIPQAVHREMLAKAGVEAERLDCALNDFIRVTPPEN